MYPKLPDIRQPGFDRPPSEIIACGQGVLECIWTYFDVAIRPVPVTPMDGVGPDTLEAALWHSGLRVQSGTMDLSDIAHHTKKGRPVICLLTADATGHWVIIQRVKTRWVRRAGWPAAKKIRYVHIQCPTIGPYWEPASVFVRRWRDRTHRRGTIYKHWGIAVFKDQP